MRLAAPRALALLGGADLTGASASGLDPANADAPATILLDLAGEAKLQDSGSARGRERAYTG